MVVNWYQFLGCNFILMVLHEKNDGEQWWFGDGGCVVESGDMDWWSVPGRFTFVTPPLQIFRKKANGMPAGKEWKYIYCFVSLLNNVQIFQVLRYLYKLQIANLIVLFIFSDMNNQLVLSWYLRQPELHRKD